MANHKGGVGKSTTAITLAHILHLAGERVTIVDLDAPSTGKLAGAASARRRGEALGIPSFTLDDMPEYAQGHLIIDSPPDAGNVHLQAALRIAEVVIVPTGDSPDDLEVALAFINENEGDYRLLLTRILGQSTRTAKRLREGLIGEGYRVFRQHITLYDEYKTAAARGTTVAGLNTYRGRKATREYERVLEELRA